MIYLQNMKFIQLILWSGGAYTDATHAATTVTTTIPYSHDSFHESRLYRIIGMVKPNEAKTTIFISVKLIKYQCNMEQWKLVGRELVIILEMIFWLTRSHNNVLLGKRFGITQMLVQYQKYFGNRFSKRESIISRIGYRSFQLYRL